VNDTYEAERIFLERVRDLKDQLYTMTNRAKKAEGELQGFKKLMRTQYDFMKSSGNLDKIEEQCAWENGTPSAISSLGSNVSEMVAPPYSAFLSESYRGRHYRGTQR